MAGQRTFLFTGGGTGGHLFPGIAVAECLLQQEGGTRIVFAGSEREIERRIIAAQGYEHRALTVEPSTTLRRNPLRFLARNWRALRHAVQMLRQERPLAVIGLGGFASVPLVVAASRLKVPIVLLEQNTVPGRATRWLCGRASLICLTFEESIRRLPKSARFCLTGNPVRREIAELFEDMRPAEDSKPPTLLVLGGSQGASAVNDAVLGAASELREQLADWKIVHQTGDRDHKRVRAGYAELGLKADVASFFEDLSGQYSAATLVVSRAGATTLAEVACAGCPAILVPYPNSIGDHQVFNARNFEAAGAAVVLLQQADDGETARTLAAQIECILQNPDRLPAMRTAMKSQAVPNAAQAVVDQLLAIATAGTFTPSNTGCRHPHAAPDR